MPPRTVRRVPNDDLRMFSVKDVADRTTLSVVEVRRRIKSGEIKSKRVGSRVMVTAAALREFMEAE